MDSRVPRHRIQTSLLVCDVRHVQGARKMFHVTQTHGGETSSYLSAEDITGTELEDGWGQCKYT